VHDFFLKESVTDREVNELTPMIAGAIRRTIDDLVQLLNEPENDEKDNDDDEKAPQRTKGEEKGHEAGDRSASDAKAFTPCPLVPRPYQIDLASRARKENLIVHMGTNTGKTLVAILVMEHHRRTLLVVPTVELAVQHFNTLRDYPGASGPMIGLCAGRKRRVFIHSAVDNNGDGESAPGHNVGSAINRCIEAASSCRAGTFVAASNEELARCRVLVGTHGAVLDLLGTYSDLFFLDGDRDSAGIDLLVLDECHHCVGDSDYAVLMREFYRPATAKPRVLGLTASPTCRASGGGTGGDSADRFRKPVEELEHAMDSRFVTQETLQATEHVSVAFLPSSILSMEDLDASIRWTDLAPVRGS
jgi:superfamily II DNA or RNA helicase